LERNYYRGCAFTQILPIVLTLSGELFPTPLRAFGTSIVNAIGRVGAIVGPLFLGVLVSRGTSLTNIVYWLAFPLVVTAILVVIFIRTDPRGKALEMISPPKTSTEEIAVL
jgi:MFS family permease